ncbi:MAG: T9SS type A sorting domain-containing protein [Bacteroidota bacterium]
MRKIYLILWLLASSNFLHAQKSIYSGGNGDGSSNSTYQQLPEAGNFIYLGGSSDGFSQNSFTENQEESGLIFLGGSGDGFSTANYISSAPAGSLLFAGGQGDGFSQASYEQDLTLLFGIFTGGDGDGADFGTYQQIQSIGNRMFAGGAGDGFSADLFQESVGPANNIYGGGPGDGFSFTTYLQPQSDQGLIFLGGSGDGFISALYQQNTPASLSTIFKGGSGDGFTAATYEEDLMLLFGVYTGGDGDGFSFSNFEQINFIDNPALPVELISLTAEFSENTVIVEWETASELNNDYFEVQQSVDLNNWTIIGLIDGHGTTSEKQTYVSYHDNPRKGLNYYRLNQVDYDGTSNYSKVVFANVNDLHSDPKLIVYPNPAKKVINIQFFNTDHQQVQLAVYDLKGQLKHQTNIQLESGKGNIRIPEGKLTPGFYLLMISSSGTYYHQKLLIK